MKTENLFFVPVGHAKPTIMIMGNILELIQEGGSVAWIGAWVEKHKVSLPKHIVEAKRDNKKNQMKVFIAIAKHIEEVLPECIELLQEKKITFSLIEKFQLFTSFLVTAHYEVHLAGIEEEIRKHREVVLLSKDYAYLIATALDRLIGEMEIRDEFPERLKKYYYKLPVVLLYYVQRTVEENYEIATQKPLIEDLDFLIADLRQIHSAYGYNPDKVLLDEEILEKMTASLN